MRMRGHAVHDDAKYVPEEMFARWRKKDPILVWGRRLKKAGLLDDDGDERLREEVRDEVEAAVEDAKAQPFPTGEGEIDEVFA